MLARNIGQLEFNQMYRVAQNKISQQTICNFSATSWRF